MAIGTIKNLTSVDATIGIVVTGSRPSMAVSPRQYVIVRNSTITGITDGLYAAVNALSPSTDVTAADLTALSGGGLNNLNKYAYTLINNVSIFGSASFFNLGGDLKAIKAGVILNTSLTAGTQYTIVTDARLASNVNWYHMITLGKSGSTSYSAYLYIGGSGEVKITPTTNVPSGSGIWICEYYL